MEQVASLDQRRLTPTTNGILAFGKDDELRKRILELSGYSYFSVSNSCGVKRKCIQVGTGW